jgi:hypothetical protein
MSQEASNVDFFGGFELSANGHKQRFRQAHPLT